MKRIALVLAGSIVLSACAHGNYVSGYSPVVDPKTSAHMDLYQSDLTDCRALAAQRNPERNAAAGVLVGALLGAAIGGAFGGQYVGSTAATGAVAGGVTAGASTIAGQRKIVDRCMAGRGYAVLD